MLSLKSLLFGALAVSASVIRRDAASIQSSLEVIDSNVRSLETSVNNYNGGLFAALPIQSAAGRLEDNIDAAIATAEASAPLNAPESTAIIAYINNTLEPDVAAALQALVNKRPQIQSAGLGGTVSGTLNTLRTKTNTLGVALIEKAAEETKPEARAALESVDGRFEGAVAAYNQ